MTQFLTGNESEDDEPDKMKIAVGRIKFGIRWIKAFLLSPCRRKKVADTTMPIKVAYVRKLI